MVVLAPLSLAGWGHGLQACEMDPGSLFSSGYRAADKIAAVRRRGPRIPPRSGAALLSLT